MMTASKLRTRAKKDLPGVVERQFKMLHERAYRDIHEWLGHDGVDASIKSVPRYFKDIGRYHASRYAASGIEKAPDMPALAISCRSALSGFLLEAPLYDFFPDNPGYYNFDTHGSLLAQLITVGWKEEAELAARVGFIELNRLMRGGVTVMRMPWFVLELAKDWLKADVNLNSEYRVQKNEDLGPWQKLLDGWRNPGEAAFDALMSEMADYHVSQSSGPRGDDDWYEFEEMSYWLFPVELLAVLRLREWLNIPTARLTHPLFSVTPLGSLYPAPERLSDKILDAAEGKFRSLYPDTPSLSDLPRLREEQAL